MRKLLALAAFVVIAGIAFAYSGAGKSTDNTRVSVPVCDWSKIESGDVFPLCYASDRHTLYIDGGRYEWDTRTHVLTDYSGE